MGNGGVFRLLSYARDPGRSQVYLIGPPSLIGAGQRFVSRFGDSLPSRGHLAIFDRSWDERVDYGILDSELIGYL